MEKIGKVVLDTACYPGEDLYSDGAVEDRILELVRTYPEQEYNQVIAREQDWAVMYHLAHERGNILSWYPFEPGSKLLEIGSGCGAVTGAAAASAASVTCVDLSRKRSLVNAYRNRDMDNITIMVGNFKDIEPHLDTDYDYVLLIGVFEYGQAYIGGASPYEDFMKICNRHRKEEGALVIAIENKFGLKYWAGCREDHLGTYFSGLEGYHEGGSARTFTRHGLEKLLASAGIASYAFYYPYPDYKFPTTIYSDAYLPKKGELCNNLRNFDRERVLLFDEKQVFDEIIGEGEFPLFSNSYLVVAGAVPEVLYAKFSNDRVPRWAIRTLIAGRTLESLHVEKQPDTEAACRHLMNTMHAYEQLSKRYEGTKIDINKCRMIGEDVKNGLAFEFCKGSTLEQLLDECLGRADVAGFKALVEEYLYWLHYNEETYAVSNFDFIFPNILVDGGQWHVIDYEWTFDKHIDAADIAFRAFYNYTLGGETRKACKDLLMKDLLGLSESAVKAAVADEREFQMRITGSHASAERMRELIGNRAYALDGMLKYCNHADIHYAAQIFVDYGEGFCEEDSVRVLDCYRRERYLAIEYDIPAGAVGVRIDPCSFSCAVLLREIGVDGRVYAANEIEVNGVWQECGWFVFDNGDPNFVIQVTGGGHLSVDMEVLELPQPLASQLTKQEPKEDLVTRTKSFLKTRLK